MISVYVSIKSYIPPPLEKILDTRYCVIFDIIIE